MDKDLSNVNMVEYKCLQKSSSRKRLLSDQNNRNICPVCTVTIRGNKMLELHLKQEIDKFDKFSKHLHRKRKGSRIKTKELSAEEETSKNNSFIDLEKRGVEFKEMKRRRYKRLANTYLVSLNKNRHNTEPLSGNVDSSYDIVSCAVCEDFLDTSEESTLRHLSKCLAKKEYEYDLFSSSDEEDEEEISWAGQRWIRSSVGIVHEEGKLTRIDTEDIDDELVVDVEHEESHGQQQFFEANIIPCPSDDTSSSDTNMVRDAVISCEKKKFNHEDKSNKHFSETVTKRNLEKEIEVSGDIKTLVESLKSKISELEDRLSSDSGKCPICMSAYIDPVVSTSCWHVCCRECWMRSLGAKKLCPKCYDIVAPSQLRKIYL